MIPVAVFWMLGAALLAGSVTGLLLRSARSRRRSSGNIVDLAAARRRKLKTVSVPAKPVEADLRKPKRSVAGGEVRAFVPKSPEARPQACSRCHKKNGPVGFYVDDYGSLVGLCKECRKSAKNRDLMPL